MVIRIKLRIFDQFVTPVSFRSKNDNTPPPPPRNAETLKTIVCQTTPLAKLRPGGGGSYLFMKYDVFKQNADFFKGMGVSSLMIHDNMNSYYTCTLILWFS